MHLLGGLVEEEKAVVRGGGGRREEASWSAMWANIGEESGPDSTASS